MNSNHINGRPGRTYTALTTALGWQAVFWTPPGATPRPGIGEKYYVQPVILWAGFRDDNDVHGIVGVISVEAVDLMEVSVIENFVGYYHKKDSLTLTRLIDDAIERHDAHADRQARKANLVALPTP